MNSIFRLPMLLRSHSNVHSNSRLSIFKLDNFNHCKFTTSSKDPMIKFLYRQGLKWCKYNQTDVKISQFIEAKIFEPPIIDAAALQRLINEKECLTRKWLPHRSVVKENQILTSIQTVSEIRNLWRAIFQLNKDIRSDESKTQACITSAFLALKDLNNLSGILQDIDAARKRHIDREGVKFQIGQVVQHKEYTWRGIIAGWEKTTQKSITDAEAIDNSVLKQIDRIDDVSEDEAIWYAVIKDSGDATLMRKERKCQFPDLNISKDGSRLYQLPLYRQSDLALVQDASLCRIRSGETSAFFDGFDSRRGCFTPNAAIKHKYPFDNGNMWSVFATTENSLSAPEISKMAKDITHAVQLFAGRLESKIVESISMSYLVRSTILTNLQDKLSRLSRGDILSESEYLEKDISVLYLASLHLKELRRCSVQLSELLTLRHFGLASRNEIKFSLGDIVQHSLYGFRGIVVGWDAKPVTDMSNWYATFGVDNPNEKPFYRIQTDTTDCLKIFGSERPFQYVCQDNLELCPRQSSFINVDTKWQRDDPNSRYIADDEAKVWNRVKLTKLFFILTQTFPEYL
jgi:hemimethylated DNA binding protein